MDARPLALLFRAWLAGERPLPLPTPGVGAVAERHRLSGALYHIGASLSGVDADTALKSWTNNVAGHLTRAAALAQVWPADAAPPLVFKGADVAEHLFDDPGARRASDLDLLLPEPHWTPVASRLAAEADAVVAPRYERLTHEAPYELGFRFGSTLLELHRDPQPPHRAHLSGAALWRRARPGRLGDTEIRVPTPEDRLLLWLTNQAKQSFHGDLADLLDLALVLRALPATTRWARTRALAWSSGLGRPYDLALLRLEASELWPWTLPAVEDPAAHLVARWLPHPHAVRRPTPQLRFQALKLWLAEGEARRAVALRDLASFFRKLG